MVDATPLIIRQYFSQKRCKPAEIDDSDMGQSRRFFKSALVFSAPSNTCRKAVQYLRKALLNAIAFAAPRDIKTSSM